MTVALLLAVALAAAPVPKTVPGDANDWPQWRGPNRDGKSTAPSLLKVWPASGPKLLWTNKNIGAGYGTGAVVGDKLYILGAAGIKAGEAESLACLDATSGEKIWSKPLNTPERKYLDGWGGGPRATPTVDGDRVYVLGSTGVLVCLAAKDGAIVWSKDLVADFKGAVPTWGYSESVLIDGENVVCTPGKGTGMVALDKKTGATAWACKEFDDVAGYSSIVIAEVGGVRQYVQQTSKSALGIRAKDGKLLWKAGELKRKTAVIPTPVLSGDYAFFTSSYDAGCECYKLEADGDGTKATKVYSGYTSVANHHGGVIGHDGSIFGHSDNGGWLCFPGAATSDEPTWQKKGGLEKGSISYADGHFYCYGETTGNLVRIEASTESWKEAGKLKLPALSTTRPSRGKVWAHPVIAQGKLFLRDYELLYAFDVK